MKEKKGTRPERKGDEVERNVGGAGGGISLWTRQSGSSAQPPCGQTGTSGQSSGWRSQRSPRSVLDKGPFYLEYCSNPLLTSLGCRPAAPGAPPHCSVPWSREGARSCRLLPSTEGEGATAGFRSVLSAPGPSSSCLALSPGTEAALPGRHGFLVGSPGQQAARLSGQQGTPHTP